MKRKKCFLLIITLCCLVSALAQQTDELKNVPGQVSIFYPMGTSGKESKNFTYNFSLNLLTGKIGALNGLEISGLYSKVKENIFGVQISGLGSIVGGKMAGMQVSGLASIVSEGTAGLQVSGLTNITSEGMSGLQVSGLTNITSEGMSGLQVSGLTNIVSEGMSGLQVSGLINIASEGMSGLQVSGLTNIASEGMSGLQVSGLINIASEGMSGLQVSGLTNIASERMSGLQVSGLANIASEGMSGLQVSGLANIASEKMSGLQIAPANLMIGRMKGVQIGLYNRTKISNALQIGLVSINDTIAKGISLSLVNIVKKGAYREFELSYSDYANVALSFKMGTQKFYTLYSAGVNFINDNLWVFGIGFGNRTPISGTFDFQPELIYSNYFPINFRKIQNISVSRLKLGFVYNINKKLGLSLAPSVYVLNADKCKNSDTQFYKISHIEAFYTNKKADTQTSLGIGFCVGLSIK
ncbi:MAG: hypothetical protein FWD66_05435 [Paludibacter sp.]|nr:hypothetical protein [Paludibacter sp.]